MNQKVDGGLSTAKEIAIQYSIPKEVLAKTLQLLARLSFNEQSYLNYRYKYVKTKNSENRHSWEIINQKLENDFYKTIS